MNLKQIVLVGVWLSLVGPPCRGASFVNGDFEFGDTTGWTLGGGYWGCCGGQSGSVYPVVPANYLPGGFGYDMTGSSSGIVPPMLDGLTDNNLNRVYAGDYSYRLNPQSSLGNVSAISQTVAGYSDPHIYFAWAAVLEDSHGPTDSSHFAFTLKDETVGDTLYGQYYSSATASGWARSSWNWFYTNWVVVDLDLAAMGRVGNTFTLSLAASGCPYGGHGGYVYLDSFGGSPPQLNATPEPSTWGLALLGAMSVVGVRLRKRGA